MEKSRVSSIVKFKEFRKHRVYKYCITSLIVVLATLIQYLIWDYIKPAPFLLFYPAIILGSLYGDGMSAIILSCLSWQYFFTNETHSLYMAWPHDYIRMGMFLASAVLIRKIVCNQTEAKLKAESVIELLNEEKESREKFVSTLTHDLQTPLTSAKLQIQLIPRRENISEKSKESLKKVEKNIVRIEEMIRDLLDANKIRAGKSLPLNLRECNLRDVIETCTHELEIIHGQRFYIKKAESVEGCWSFEALRRILENLGSNAIKYGDADAPVEICGERAFDGICLSVHNKGPVIPLEEQKELFNPYRRSKSAFKSSEKGWGLGLSLVKGLTEAHGGSVKVQSSEGNGTTFMIYLPLDSRKYQSAISA